MFKKMKTGNFAGVLGNFSRFWGKQFSFALAALVFTTVFLWSWEKNPLVTNLLSAHDQFIMRSSEFLVDEFAASSISKKPSKRISQKYTHSQLAEDTTEEKMAKGANNFERITVSSERKEACNYAKGKWVADSRRPLYSGLGCKQWLAEMWACRLTQRADFSYEGYRWQPDNCEMPEFEGSEFFKRMQDKTIAFIGDSIGRQQFQSLMCMVTGGEERLDVEDVGWKYGLLIPDGAIRPDGWAYRFPYTNTTILYYWSASLCGIEAINASDPATEYAMHLDQPPQFLSRFIGQFDVVVLNTGHHWNRGKLNANRWVMHVKGKPVIDRKLARMWNAKNFTVYSMARWLDSQILLRPQLKGFFRTISPRHFLNGEWNSGGSCDNIIPLSRGNEVREDESSDPVVAGAVIGTKVKILDITAISELRDEAHISHYSTKAAVGINDCLHWCLPGIPDTWNELLYAQL